jgi:hypothetical protein
MNMAVGGSAGRAGNFALADDVPLRHRSQWSHHRRAASNEGYESGLRASVEDMFSGPDKSLRGLFGTERIPDHRVASRRWQAGRGHGLRRLAVPDGTVDEISTIPDELTRLMQIGNLPDETSAGVADSRPVPAGRRNEARTCDGGCRRRSGPRPALSPCGLRCAVLWGDAPRPASMPGLPLFSGWESFLGRGDPECSVHPNA